jgi:hypothetical protein
MGCNGSKGAAPRSKKFDNNKPLREANLEPLTPAQITAFDDWWSIVVNCLSKQQNFALF